ncbi:Subtilase family protein [compost metagenome]
MGNELYTLPAQLESVRIQLTDGSQRSLWGNTTESAVLIAETRQYNRRIYCMAIGAESLTFGRPSSWSATVDKLIFNDGENYRLMVIAAGNVQPLEKSGYPTRNLATLLHDPAQARNAITVGAMCNYEEAVNSPTDTLEVFAKKGELSPHSRTHAARNDAIKPDIVCEGGNVAWDGLMACSELEGLAILTTYTDYIRNDPYNLIGGTSPAAAEASRILAQIWEANPELKPTTVRALLIHSADWTDAMKSQFPNKKDLFRACGYGTPNVYAACRSAKSAVTLVSEGSLRPYYRERIMGKRGRMKWGEWKRDIILFDLPWPEDDLNQLGELPVELRVTLSYFSEPNPKNVLRAYEGMGLEWDLQRADETTDQFIKRINHAEREEGESGFESSKDWKIGKQARSRGTIQSDGWSGLAVELASRKKLAVYPTGGWWGATDNQIVPFSLVVSVKTEDTELDLYNKVGLQISNSVVTSVDIES